MFSLSFRVTVNLAVLGFLAVYAFIVYTYPPAINPARFYEAGAISSVSVVYIIRNLRELMREVNKHFT